MPVWYIQEYNQRDGTTQRLILTVKEMGYRLHVDKYIPFDDQHDLSFLPTTEPVVFHGAISCVRSVQDRKLNLRPFAWFDFNALRCQSYYAHWGPWLAQRIYGFYPLGVLRDKADWLFEVFGRPKREGGESYIFLRPDANDKTFTGEIVSQTRFDSWINWTWVDDNLADLLVVVSQPERLGREWRLFVQDGKVITGSRYMDRGVLDLEPEYPDGAVQVAEAACKVWTPHPIFCMDMAETDDGYRILECGSINCAGYYAADLRVIVRAISDSADRS